MLAELVGRDSKMEEACSQKSTYANPTLLSDRAVSFSKVFFPSLRALESSYLYFDPSVCLMKILCLSLQALHF